MNWLDDLNPQDAAYLVSMYNGREYIKTEVGLDDYTRWEITVNEIGSNTRGRSLVRAYRDIDTDAWTLSVAGVYVDEQHRTSPAHWEKTFGSYWELYETVRDYQGLVDAHGVLICPVLPTEGWYVPPKKTTYREVEQ